MKSSLIFLAVLLGCAADPVADAQPREHTAKPPLTAASTGARPAAAPETQLGVADRGIFSDLDGSIQLPAPDRRAIDTVVIDPERRLLTVYDGPWPLKIYPIGGAASARIGGETIALRPGDAAELAGLGSVSVTKLDKAATPPGGDADGDGIADLLDLRIGAHKTVANGASYGAGYIRLDFPMGDVPRDVGVCTDVIIRAVRNAGVDLQAEVNRDIKRARRAYPMVKRPNAHIDHRRVKTLLPYFKRHWTARSKALADSGDPLEPGDVVFMDTFPSRPGPDHIGIVSSRKGPSGHPLIINNWTDGTKTAEMDLLAFVPVTHRFRLRPQSR